MKPYFDRCYDFEKMVKLHVDKVLVEQICLTGSR